jgi:hypothetical protein
VPAVVDSNLRHCRDDPQHGPAKVKLNFNQSASLSCNNLLREPGSRSGYGILVIWKNVSLHSPGLPPKVRDRGLSAWWLIPRFPLLWVGTGQSLIREPYVLGTVVGQALLRSFFGDFSWVGSCKRSRYRSFVYAHVIVKVKVIKIKF